MVHSPLKTHSVTFSLITRFLLPYGIFTSLFWFFEGDPLGAVISSLLPTLITFIFWLVIAAQKEHPQQTNHEPLDFPDVSFEGVKSPVETQHSTSIDYAATTSINNALSSSNGSIGPTVIIYK